MSKYYVRGKKWGGSAEHRLTPERDLWLTLLWSIAIHVIHAGMLPELPVQQR